MELGKVKITHLGIFSSKLSFHDYGHYVFTNFRAPAKRSMIAISENASLKGVPYLKTDNFYIQILAAYVATHWHLWPLSRNIPDAIHKNAMEELKKGYADGISDFKIGKNAMHPYFIDLHKYCLIRYAEGMLRDAKKSNATTQLCISEFASYFMEDLVKISKRDGHKEMSAAEYQTLSAVISLIPGFALSKISKVKTEYILPK